MAQMTGDQPRAELIAAEPQVSNNLHDPFPKEAARSRAMAAGACAYLNKPADGDTTVRCLSAAVEHRRAPGAPLPRYSEVITTLSYETPTERRILDRHQLP